MEKFDPHIGPARGLIAKRLSMAEFDLVRLAPSGAVDCYIENYWVIEWDRGDAPVYTQENLPHPSAHLVLDPQAGSGLFGVHTRRFFYSLGGKGRIIGAKFRPGQLYPLWQQPMTELTDKRATDLSRWGIELAAFEREFVAMSDPAEMADRLDQLFAALAVAKDSKAEQASQLVELIDADKELTSVAELAVQAEMSVRQLQRLFEKYIGVSPKWVIDRYRMIEAVEAINQGEERSLTELAHRLGYFDQAHFSKAFSTLLGRTPQQLLAQSG